MTSPRRWPNEAVWALEDVKAALLDIEVLAAKTQELTQDPLIAKLQTDVRIRGRDAFTQLTLARAGIYEEKRA